MTQPRYLLFIAAIYRSMERALERRKGSVEDLLRRSREMQDQLRDVLATTYQNKRGYGVIGISVREPERYPSAIYWASLRVLGIFRRRGMAEGEYLRSLEGHYEASRSESNNGDPVAEVATPAPAWDRKFPYASGGEPVQDALGRFAQGIDFALLPADATYLADCYLRPDTKDQRGIGLDRSLLAFLIERRRKTSFAFPWDVKPPPHLDQVVDDAKRFSVLARGATLQYYFWLIEARRQQGWDVPGADIGSWFAQWWAEGRPQVARLAGGRLPDAASQRCAIGAKGCDLPAGLAAMLPSRADGRLVPSRRSNSGPYRRAGAHLQAKKGASDSPHASRDLESPTARFKPDLSARLPDLDRSLLNVLHLLAHLLDRHLHLHRQLGQLQCGGFGAQGVGFALQLLDQKVQAFAEFAAAGE